MKAGNPGPGRLRTFRALRHRNYRLFFSGQMVSLAGSWVQITALMWLAFHLTGTSRWPALMAAAQLVPACLFGAWGGVFADRWPKRTILVLTQTALLGLAGALALLAQAGVASVWHLLFIATAIGLVNAVDLPARLAFLAEMVGKEDLVNAVALNSLAFNLARAAGPAAAAWLLPRGGASLCFALNALSYLAVLTALVRMRPPAVATRARPREVRPAALGGFRYVAAHPGLRLLLPLTGVMALFGWPILALLPALSQYRLDVGESGYGSLLSALGGGALTAAFLVASFGSFSRRRTFFTAGVVVASSALVGLSVAPTLPVAMACCGLVGVGLILFFSTSQAVVQLSAGDHNRGRVMGIYSIVLAGANPLGNLLAGPAADWWGESLVLRVQGLSILAAATAIGGLWLLRRSSALAPVPVQAQPVPAPSPARAA